MMSTPGRNRIILNVSGQIYETYETTLQRFPDTLLGNSFKLKTFYCAHAQQYFFNRHRVSFESILYFYQSKGVLRCPPGVKFGVFEKECRFFELPESTINKLKTEEGIIIDFEEDKNDAESSLKMKIWNVLENPASSRLAWLFGVFSCVMIFVSVITHILETMPHAKRKSKRRGGESHEGHAELHSAEFIINGWFVTEFLLRLLFCPLKVKFAKGVMNWVDMLSVAPYYVVLVCNIRAKQLLGVLRTLKYFRVLRLFRLSKHSKRLKVVGIIFRSSLGNLKLLLTCLMIVVVFGAIIIYYVESMETHESLNSIPECLWWGVQTITSVGYGDMIPKTILGRLFSCCFMIFGALTMSFPVLTIVSHFAVVYPKNIEIVQSCS